VPPSFSTRSRNAGRCCATMPTRSLVAVCRGVYPRGSHAPTARGVASDGAASERCRYALLSDARLAHLARRWAGGGPRASQRAGGAEVSRGPCIAQGQGALSPDKKEGGGAGPRLRKA
jgi:hypothetical protein